MAIFNWLKPKWQHRDKAVRLAAVAGLGSQDTEVLGRVAGTDVDPEVRLAAVARISDPVVLTSLAAAAADEGLRQAIEARLRALLVETVLTGPGKEAREAALGRLDDQQSLARIAVEAEDAGLRLLAVARLSNETVLAGLLEQPCAKEVAQAAFAKIKDPDLWRRLAGGASSRAVRKQAAERLGELEPQVAPASRNTRALEALVREAQDLADSRQWDRAAGRLVAIRQAWAGLDPEAAHPGRAAVEQAVLRFEDRRRQAEAKRVQELKRAEEYAQETARRETICQSIEELIGSLAPDADASFQQAVAAWPGPGSFAGLTRRFTEAGDKYKVARAAIDREKKQLAGLAEDLGRLEHLVEGEDWQAVNGRLETLATAVAGTKFRYLAKLELADRLTAVRKRYSERLAARRLEEDQQVRDNLDRRRDLAAELEKLVDLANRSEAEKRARDIETAWMALQPAADDQESSEIVRRYAEARGRFDARQNEFLRQQDWQLWANRNLKEELCRQVETLDSETDLGQVAERIKKAQGEWKKIGPLPRKESEKLWQRFHEACERNFARCAPYFAEQEQVRTQTISRKEEICHEAEQLAESTAWKETARRLKELQTEWKGLAVVPRHKEEKLYQRFRQACNQFFSRSSQHFSDRDQELGRNLAAKIKLCEEVETITVAPEPGRQREYMAAWKAIGPVPRERSDEVWQRFQAGLARLQAIPDSGRLDNLARKEALIARLTELTGAINEATDLRSVARLLVALKAEWQTIGPVPEASREELGQRFAKLYKDFFALHKERLREAGASERRNLRQKVEILARAEALAEQEVWDEAAVEAMRGLEGQWREIGPLAKAKEVQLREEFKGVCAAFLAGQREFFSLRAQARLNNQRRKEILCLQLENLLGLPQPAADPGQRKVLTLAEEMKLALEINSTYAGLRDDEQRLADEVQRLKSEWRKIGLAPKDQEQILVSRFRRAGYGQRLPPATGPSR